MRGIRVELQVAPHLAASFSIMAGCIQGTPSFPHTLVSLGSEETGEKEDVILSACNYMVPSEYSFIKNISRFSLLSKDRVFL